ncbi:MAG: leucine-rich repeat domain-containing protein, partial [Candidatus Hermodarchaeota archaeon]
YLENNQLKTLPESIGQLTNLVEIRLESNQLKTLQTHLAI